MEVERSKECEFIAGGEILRFSLNLNTHRNKLERTKKVLIGNQEKTKNPKSVQNTIKKEDIQNKEQDEKTRETM